MTNSDRNQETMPTRQYQLWWGALLLVLGAVLGAGFVELLKPASAKDPAGTYVRTSPQPVLGQVSDFSLTERDGRTVNKRDLEGRVWIADFFFTSCAGVCPMMSSAMSRLQERLADMEGVTLVSISVDPERDTPERLRRYADRYEADPARWWFLTGDKADIYRLSRESFRLSVEENTGDSSDQTEDVLHSSKFVLLDQEGRIRGYYEGDVPEALDALVADVRFLAND
jgi:protein SCO1/2